MYIVRLIVESMALVEVDKLSRDLLVKFCCREELFKEEQAEKLEQQRHS